MKCAISVFVQSDVSAKKAKLEAVPQSKPVSKLVAQAFGSDVSAKRQGGREGGECECDEILCPSRVRRRKRCHLKQSLECETLGSKFALK